MLLPAAMARASIALLTLQTLNTVQARYLPPLTAPYAQRDDNSYRLKSYGSGYKIALASNNNGTFGLTVEGDDVVYSVNIVIGGHEVALQIDTGSTDLWVFAPEGSIKTSNTTSISTELRYGSGQLDGTIQFADVQIGSYTVPNQAFLNATTTQGMEVMFQRNIFGILGLGFTERTPDFTPSAINAALQHAFGNDSALGESLIGNIYKLNTSLPNIFDIHIGRSSDLDDVSDGLFNIGEHVPGYEAVEQRPKLPRISSGRWGVPLDGFQVNGESVPMGNKSVVPGAPDGKLVAVLDTGATLPQIPWNVYKTIYDSIPGAVYDNGYGSWFLPCDAAVNLTIIMGGEPIPIHPLDITRVIVLQAELNGTLTNTTVCTDAWQAFNLPPSFTGLDILMGDSFLRNVYASYDFGDQGTEDNSFIQLLPTTDANAAWSEFFTMRAEALSKLPPAYPPADLFKWAANSQPASTASSTTSSPATQPVSVDDESTSSVTDAAMRLSDPDNANAAAAAGTLDKWGPIVVGLLAGNLFVTLVLCAIGVGLYLKSRRGARQPVRNLNTVSYGPVMTKDRDMTEYSDSFMVNARH